MPMVRARRELVAGIVAGGVCAVVMAGLSASPVAASQDPFAEWRSGASGHHEALDDQRKTGRPVALYFYTDWCPYCRRFEADLLASKEFAQYRKTITAVRINPEKGEAEETLATTYGVRGYPTFLILASGAGEPQRMRTSQMTPAQFVRACEAAGKSSTPIASRTPQTARTPPTTSAPSAKTRPTPQGPAYVARRPVTLVLRNGKRIQGDLVMETPHSVRLRWGYGDAVFERREIERIVPDQTPVQEEP